MGLMSGLFRLVHGRKVKALAAIPGPTPKFPFGTALDFVCTRQKPWEVCADYATKYGGMTLIWTMGKPGVVLNDPALIKQVLETDADSYYKGLPDKPLIPVLTKEEMFISTGEHWSFMRGNSPFNMPGATAWMEEQVPVLRDFIASAIGEQSKRDQPVDLLPAFWRIYYDAFSQIVWGKTFGDTNYNQFMKLGRKGSKRLTSPMQFLPVLSPFFYATRANYHATFRKEVEEAKAHPDPQARDLLSVVLRTGTKLDDRLLALTLSATLYFGGALSASSAMLTTLYLMAKDPALAERVCGEVRQHVKPGVPLDIGALEQCKQLDFVLREAMRYWPPVPLYFRNVRRDKPAQLGGHTLPPDTLIFISNWHLQRESTHWKEPQRIDPSRWDNGGREANPLGSDYFFPFGRGPRSCAGQQFAMIYMKTALATILSDYRLEIDPTQPFVQDYFFAVMAAKGIKGKLVREV